MKNDGYPDFLSIHCITHRPEFVFKGKDVWVRPNPPQDVKFQ